MANLTPNAAKNKPGAAATATGSISFEQFTTKEYRNRAEAATALCYAIANCDPEDAAQIMTSVLIELSAGMPIAELHGVMEQAAFWADLATPPELDAYALACTNRMAPARRAAFVAYVGGLQ